jgi:hypothetical protein
MGDVTGWELGATYESRSFPKIQDTVLSAQTHVVWSERWGRHVPTWPAEQVTVWRENPALVDQVVDHGTPFDLANWTRVT